MTSALGGLLVPLLGTAPASAAERSTSTTRVSAPNGTVAPGSTARVYARLLSDGEAVRGATVDVQVPAGRGAWRTVGRGTTDAEGLTSVRVRVQRDTTVRAHYRGSETRAADTSGTDVIDVRTSSRSASRTGGSVVSEAAKHRGKPYRYGATGPSAFDCSGYTAYVYKKATGKTLPHNARRQEAMATRVSKSEARPGDLVFMQDVAGHVGIYAGNGQMWDAPRSGKTVSKRAIWSSNYTVGRV